MQIQMKTTMNTNRKTNMKSAIDTTTNAQERIEFAFNAINNLEGQNLESILSNKENVIETYKLARDKEHISDIKTDNYSNILEYGNSETLYDGYNNGSLNESLKTRFTALWLKL